MSIISLIAAVDESLGLGINNGLLCHLPADLAYFKKTTLNKPIIMGRKTFESIGRPLPHRQNIVISQTMIAQDKVQIAPDLARALELAAHASEIMIIGGASIYKEAIYQAHRIYLTRIHHQFNADVFFPNIDKHQWHLINTISRPADEQNQYDLTFSCYERLTAL